MLLKRISILFLVFLWIASAYGEVPGITKATYDEESNILSLFFNGDIRTETEYFSIGGLTFDDDEGGMNPDLTLNGGDILNTNPTGNQLDIYLLFEGNIGFYTQEGESGVDTFYTWGIDKSNVIGIESFENKNALTLKFRENTYLSTDFEPNPMMTTDSVVYFTTPSGNIPELMDAAYDAATNTLTLTFDAYIQWDSIDEDRIDPLTGQGSGQLEYGEDRNDNGVLDFEANVVIQDNLVLGDGEGMVPLTLDEILTLNDSTVIEIHLLPDNAKLVENLDLANLNISFPAYTFVDVDYNTVAPVSQMPVTVSEDPDPLKGMEAEYDMLNNQLEVVFNKDLATGFNIIPKFMFVIAEIDTVALQGASATPVISNDKIKIKLLNNDQQMLEEEIYALDSLQLETEVQILIEPNAIRDEFGNYNIFSDIDPIVIEYSEVAPYPDSVAYNACSNVLSITFTEKILSQPTEVNLQGISVLQDTVEVTLETAIFSVSSNKKTLNILLDEIDEYNLENITDTTSLKLLMQPYSVLQFGKYNGNAAVTAGSNVFINWLPDSTAPLPEVVKYNETTRNLMFKFNDAMDMNVVDLTGFAFAGLNFAGESLEFGDNPHWIIVTLTLSEISAVENLAIKDSIFVSLPQGAFTNIRGAANLASDFNDRDLLYHQTDTVTVMTGYGRDFYLASKELTPTLDRIIPATIRKEGEHCVIWVADDQWAPYDSMFIGIRYYKTNNGQIPTNPEEVETVYDFFENYTVRQEGSQIDTLEGAYPRLNQLFAGGSNNFVPVCNILMCDIRDEFAMDRTSGNANQNFWIGSFFNPNDQLTAFEAGEDVKTNECDLIYVDTWPQTFTQTDVSWYTVFDVDEPYLTIDWQAFSVANGKPMTADNAIVNAYTKLIMYKVDPWEPKWVREGMSSLAELMILGDVTFYGGGTPSTPARNALKNMDNGLDVKNDYFHTYLFMLYLYEKFGGEELIELIALRPEVDVAAIDSALYELRDMGVIDPDLQTRLEDFTTSSSNIRDIYSYFAMACLLDTTNMNYITDPLIPPDDFMFKIDHINLYGKVSGKNAPAMKWKASNPPPYYITATSPTSPHEDWSFTYYYTTYGVGLTNPMLDDDSIIKTFINSGQINTFSVLCKNDGTQNIQPEYIWEYYDYNDYMGESSFAVSPATSWTPGLDSLDYKSFIIVTVLGGTGKITLDTEVPDYYLSLSQSALVSNRFDAFLIANDGIFGDGSLGGNDVPQVRYDYQGQTSQVLMNPNYYVIPPEDTVGISFFSSYLDLQNSGNYDIYAFFTSLGGEEIITSPGTYVVDSFQPGKGTIIGLDGSSFKIEANSYGQSFNLLLNRLNYNAGEKQEYLYDYTYYTAPPVEDRNPIGPAYYIQPEVNLAEPATIILPYGDYYGDSDPAELGIYLYRNDSWDYLQTTVNVNARTVTVRAKQLGLFQIQAGPHGNTPADLIVPQKYALAQNYPNPFNPATRIDYQLNRAGKTTLKIYNIMGQEVAQLVDGFQNTGFYSVAWEGKSDKGLPVSSGVYLYRLESGEFSKTCKMILLK